MVYSTVIRDRFRHPRFRGRIAEPQGAFEDVNPLCGDRIRIECRIVNGTLSDARHHGDSCAICAASADVLLEMVVGRATDQAAAVPAAAVLERLEAEIRPTRMRCVTLPISVLQAALSGGETPPPR
ncbi:MAG: iron-sulfur cluster assembly scaffold protein [Candidatus Rokubacteria bacterium]|nr:iron-sulfur cluster assembly scaffold protein [Candidatus Rokubacteria bacterium]